MHYIVVIVIALLCILPALHCWRKKRILKKIARMSPCEKYSLLDSVAKPFGYKYIPEWDVFSSRVDAWQRQFGYGTVYDQASVYFNMVLQTLPVYFDYEGRTWLIQVWKGQYGICAGCELGLYHANGLVDESQRKDAVFQAVDNDEMLDLSIELWRQGINHFNCNLFCFVTRCCYSSCDRILYLYFYLPLICRHLLRLRHFPRKKKRGRMP